MIPEGGIIPKPSYDHGDGTFNARLSARIRKSSRFSLLDYRECTAASTHFNLIESTVGFPRTPRQNLGAHGLARARAPQSVGRVFGCLRSAHQSLARTRQIADRAMRLHGGECDALGCRLEERFFPAGKETSLQRNMAANVLVRSCLAATIPRALSARSARPRKRCSHAARTAIRLLPKARIAKSARPYRHRRPNFSRTQTTIRTRRAPSPARSRSGRSRRTDSRRSVLR